MSVVAVLVVILLVFVVLSAGHHVGVTRHAEGHEHLDLEPGYSYLYYIDQDGILCYMSESCRDCMKNIAEDLKKRGCKVTEMHLGNLVSGELYD